MSRVQPLLIALGMAFALPALAGADPPPAATTLSPSSLSGTWQSAPDERPLNSAFDESVWGKNARAVRTVQMTVRPGGDTTLTVTRKVVDARGRTVAGSTSIEHVDMVIGGIERSTDLRADLAVTVNRAERRYPDEPEGTWAIDGLRVIVTAFPDDPTKLEVRLDPADGRGSFWETLRSTGKSVNTTARR